jgi:hypothetical protein
MGESLLVYLDGLDGPTDSLWRSGDDVGSEAEGLVADAAVEEEKASGEETSGGSIIDTIGGSKV